MVYPRVGKTWNKVGTTWSYLRSCKGHLALTVLFTAQEQHRAKPVRAQVPGTFYMLPSWLQGRCIRDSKGLLCDSPVGLNSDGHTVFIYLLCSFISTSLLGAIFCPNHRSFMAESGGDSPLSPMILCISRRIATGFSCSSSICQTFNQPFWGQGASWPNIRTLVRLAFRTDH